MRKERPPGAFDVETESQEVFAVLCVRIHGRHPDGTVFCGASTEDAVTVPVFRRLPEARQCDGCRKVLREGLSVRNPGAALPISPRRRLARAADRAAA